MRRVASGFPLSLFAALCGFALLICPRLSTAQSIQVPTVAQQHGDSRAADDFASTGHITVQIQDELGAPFFQGAKVSLLTNAIDNTLSLVSDPGGKVNFLGLPVGAYVVEVYAAGYRTAQQQVLISGSSKSQSLTFSMLPAASNKKAVKVRVGSDSVSSKAVKESERALHSLQLNNLDEAHKHLDRALVFDQSYSEANYLMGLVLLRQKDFLRAVGYLQKSLALSPDQAPALLALSQAQYLQQDYPAATASLEEFLRDYPHDVQAANAQKYLDSMQKSHSANAAGTTTAEATQPGPSDNPAASAGAAAAADDLPSLLDSFTESNAWAPPNVDDEKLDLDTTSAPCKLDSVLHSAGQRVQELVQNVDRFTATEHLEHTNLNRMGMKTYAETRKFNYLVEIRPVDKTGINVEEYRNGSDSAKQFPEEISTSGLPALALIFHPNLQSRYEFACEGRSTRGGRTAWIVRFEQRSGRSSSMLTYLVGQRSYAVGLKGRAWIDAGNSQVIAMESDNVRPVPEIRLVRDHQLIEYGPVSFQNKSLELWLPKSADWYCSLNGKRFHRRHTFSQFLLFSVDDKQKISAPEVPTTTETPQ